MFSRMLRLFLQLLLIKMKLAYRTTSLMWHILPSVPRIYLWEDDLDLLFILELSA